MGVLDFFSKDGRDERARQKNAARAINKYAQSPDRMKAFQGLRDDGSDEALYALMKRFGMRYDKTIEDEQEKEWVFEVLVEKGATVLPALKRYLESADSISWPLRLLDKVVATKDEQIDVVAAALERHEPGYERDPTKKVQLLSHISGFKNARVATLAVPYLADMDEGVRYAAVDAMLRQADEATCRAPLIDHFVSPTEESLRLRIRLADGFAELGWPVGDKRAEVEKRLPDAFQIEGRAADARITRKNS